MRTTTRENWRFRFGISDIGKLLGKSPVTLRGWESQGLITIPRGRSGAREVTVEGVRRIAGVARGNGRITVNRYNLICATMTLLEEIEGSNNRKVKT